MSNTYSIIAGDETEARATRSSKATAVGIAKAIREDERVATRVVTSAGNVVASFDAPRKIKMSAPYTRVVVVAPEVVETIDGARVAYKRGPASRSFALLDDARGAYRIWDIERRENVDVEVATTRDAGRWFADERRAYAASTPVD